MEAQVKITRPAQKALLKAPKHIRDKFVEWAASVQKDGLENTRKVPAFHDELLKGQRNGQRSIRLNLHWRAIYTETVSNIILVTVLEVTAHDYRTK